MNRQACIYRMIMVSARTTAVVGILIAWIYICGTMAESYGIYLHWKEISKVLPLVGYILFVLFPVRAFSSKGFYPMVAVGFLLALGSIFSLYDIYVDLVVVALKGQFIYHIMAWSVLIPVYGYIPVLLTARRLKSANQRV